MIKINKIRKGKTFQAYWPITTNGSIVPLLGRDLTLYIIDPTELYKEISFTVENTNKLLFTYEGTEQKLCGIYRILLVENKNQKNQSLVDSLAFELVPKSEDEYIYNSNSIIDNIRIINLNVSNLGIISNEEDSPSTPSTPTNPNYQSGEKEVSGFKEVEVSKESGATNIYKLMYTDGTFSTIKATNGKDGVSPKISIGQVETLELGQQAYVENVGTDTNVVLKIGIPKGEEGTSVDSEARNDISRITNILGRTYNPEDPSGESDKALPVEIKPLLSLGVEVAKITDSLGNVETIRIPFSTELNVSGLASFSNIEALKNASGLKAGDTVMTKGYYSANDGGGSFFTIISSTSDTVKNYADKSWKLAKSGETTPYVDDATLIALPNGLYASIMVPSNGTINFLLMGARKMSIIHTKSPKQISLPDNKPYMMKWLAFLDRKKTTYNLYISDGIYSFSETWLLRSDGNSSCMGIRIYGECCQSSGGEGSIIIPHYTEQQFIFRVGYFDSDKSQAIAMRQVVLLNLNFGTTRYAWQGNSITFKGMNIGSTYVLSDESGTTGSNFTRYVTKGALVLENCPYGQFDGLYFQNVSGTSMYLIQCYESHFGYTNIRGCKRITSTGYTYPMVYINAPGPSSVSACYFYYFNFEGCYGDLFYSKTANFTHNEFNNIQIEGSVDPPSISSVIGAIDKQSKSLKYDTDPDYTIPSVGNGNTFGKWIKWFVFTGNMGSAPNYINSISVSNFGNGFKKYRTYRMSNGNLIDMDGNTVTGNYEYNETDKVYYALDENNNRIVDYYRYYALFGEDENNPRDIQMVSGTPVFGSFVWNIGSVYLFRQEGMNSYNGPWVVYLRMKPKGFHLAVNHNFDRKDYPYYFQNVLKGNFARGACSTPGAIPFVDLLHGSNGAQAMVSTRSGSCSPNGLCVKYLNAFSFVAMPGKQYGFRAYCPTSVYNTLLLYNLSGGKPFIKWKGLLCTESSDNPYTGNATSIVNNSGWIYITLPDLQLTKPTAVYFGASGLFDAYSRNFIVGLSLDVLIS